MKATAEDLMKTRTADTADKLGLSEKDAVEHVCQMMAELTVAANKKKVAKLLGVSSMLKT